MLKQDDIVTKVFKREKNASMYATTGQQGVQGCDRSQQSPNTMFEDTLNYLINEQDGISEQGGLFLNH